MDGEKTNEVVISTGKKIAVGPEWWELRDDGIRVDYVDMLVEARQFNGIVHLSMGVGVQDANNSGVVHVANRVRMNLIMAQTLHNLLGAMIDDAMKPADKSQAN